MEENNTTPFVDPMATPNTKIPRRPEPKGDNNLFKQPAKNYYGLLKVMTAIKNSPVNFETIGRRISQAGEITKEAKARAGMLESKPPNTVFPQNEEAQSLLEMVKRIQGE